MTTPIDSVFVLRAKLTDAEQQVRSLEAALRDAIERAQRAERSSRDAWAYFRSLTHHPAPKTAGRNAREI